MTGRWRYYPGSCDECGKDLQVFTESEEEGFVYDGDTVQCFKCGAVGVIEVYDVDDIRIQWSESAGGE